MHNVACKFGILPFEFLFHAKKPTAFAYQNRKDTRGGTQKKADSCTAQ